MSEKEILRRQEYKANRKKWLMIQTIALLLAIVFAFGSFLVYDRMNKTYYIEYTENSSTDYCVQYQENDFFADQWIEKDQAYIVPLIENILADFHYRMDMDSSNISFDYSYSINARMDVSDKDSGKPFYTVEDVLLPCKQVTTQNSSQMRIDEQVEIDFQHYNKIAKQFTTTYGLNNSTSTLVVTLKVQVLSSCDQFEENNENTYYTAINIPLNEDTISIHTTSSAPAAESKVLAYQSAVNRQIFLWTGYVASALSLLLVLILVIFAHMTKNEDVTYTAKIQRLLRSYSSFIQRVEGTFDDQGYQIVPIKTFEELLGIRDTLQAPVLMTENKDQTMSRFLIPTEAKLLYVFEIRVDNYDELYSPQGKASVKCSVPGKYLK